MVPPKGARYDKDTEKIVIDPVQPDDDTQPDERLAKVLVDIANSIMKCIQMEADWPSKNSDKRLPILDMKTWTNQDGDVVYAHYEKPVSSKTVLHSKSAHVVKPFSIPSPHIHLGAKEVSTLRKS